MKILYLLANPQRKIIFNFAFLFFSLMAHAGESNLIDKKQLVVFESETCGSCKEFEKDVTANWKSSFSIEKTYNMQAPTGLKLKESVWATPTLSLIHI